LNFLELTPLARGESNHQAQFVARWETRINEARKFYELGCSRNREGQFEEAAQALACALELSPNNIGIEFELARAFSSIGRLDEAGMLFEGIIHKDPGNGLAFFHLGSVKYRTNVLRDAVELWECASRLLGDPSDSLENLAMAYRRIGRTENEKNCWLRLREFCPEHPLADHMLAAHSEGPLPDRAADLYLQHLFNRFSHDFDHVLMALNYSVPALLDTVLREVVGAPDRSLKFLDAGCGTGLCGEKLRPWARHLTGVDISTGMLAKATSRNIYDELIESELNAFLGLSNERYDWIVAGDVLCYFGDLAGIVRAASRSLVPGGRMYFSVEKDCTPNGEKDNGMPSYRLQSHGRYCHTQTYLESVVTPGLRIERLSAEIIRYESGRPVEGFSVVLRKCNVR
jgi:predicted TPR repeat methyltransferase